MQQKDQRHAKSKQPRSKIDLEELDPIRSMKKKTRKISKENVRK